MLLRSIEVLSKFIKNKKLEGKWDETVYRQTDQSKIHTDTELDWPVIGIDSSSDFFYFNPTRSSIFFSMLSLEVFLSITTHYSTKNDMFIIIIRLRMTKICRRQQSCTSFSYLQQPFESHKLLVVCRCRLALRCNRNTLGVSEPACVLPWLDFGM